MLEVDFMQARDDRKEWQIKAARMYSLDGEKDIRLEDVEALFYGKSVQEQGQTRISSRKARYNADNQLLNLQDQVVIRDNRGYEIRTESLNYLDKEKKINTDSKVQINGSNISVSGERLIYDVESGNYRLDGNVVCKVW
jgi:LPS export ABC transporter protein LptC